MLVRVFVIFALFEGFRANRCSSSDTLYQCSHVEECEIFITGLRDICHVLSNLFTEIPGNIVVEKGTDSATEEIQTTGPVTVTEINSKFVPPASYGPTGELDLIDESVDKEENGYPSLIVKSAAEIVIAPRNITVPPGATAQFRCRSQGAPPPLTTITKRIHTLTEVKKQFNQIQSEQLTSVSIIQEIENVSKQNEGWYRCTASNVFGTNTADAYLHILDLCTTVTCSEAQTCRPNYLTGTAECVCDECPTANNIVCGTDCQNYFNPCFIRNKNCREGTHIEVLSQGYCPQLEEPALTIPSEDVYLNPGENLRLECGSGSALPQPEVYWVIVEEDGGLKKVSNSPVLEIRRVKETNSGEYRCVASQCMKVYESESIRVLVEEEEDELDELTFEKKVCSVYGDPHLSTFDGFTYDYMGVCDYVLAMDCEFASWLVYGRLDKCSKEYDIGSCLSSITVYMGRTVMELQRGWVINNAGTKMDITEGEVMRDGGMTITFDGRHLKVVMDSMGVEVHWDGLVSVHILIPPGIHSCGLCGDNDGNPDNDMIARHQNSASSSILKFANSWEVDSLDKCAEQVVLTNRRCSWGSRKKSKQRCKAAFSVRALNKCKDAVDPTSYIKSCEFDVCTQSWLAQKLAPECVALEAYVKRCDIAGVTIKNWQSYASCPSTYQIQDIILDEGCPQDVERLLRRRVRKKIL